MTGLTGRLTPSGALGGTVSGQGQLVGGLNSYIHPPTHDYETEIVNKPQINSVELVGNKSFGELGLVELTNMELEALLTL